ncbi:alkaline phosphatase D [Haloferula luteola]|uniref:Alkaline phosphatase D n=1 Tax=Haloferula luteola TaxID=595692 RepID=A0A840V4W6_9BACT|nr:alkaline phosphatase D family protein [Haloferula luteola]MBB5352086.1 alkaline phosphatase D [Haloferula luteola]
MKLSLTSASLFVSVTCGLQADPPPVSSGDVSSHTAVVWSRSVGADRMLVETDTDPDFSHPIRHPEVSTGADQDFTARALLNDLPAGTRIHYRVTFPDGSESPPSNTGSFKTAPIDHRNVRFAWSGDTVGQGWGIDPERGGMQTYETLRAFQPDFFIHNGDLIYADDPLEPEVPLADGSVWKNRVTPEKSKVAETLAEFRGAYRYQLLDPQVRRFLAEVPVFAQWDDHEVANNWYPGETLSDPRYTEKRASVLAERSHQAFIEYTPVAIDSHEPHRIYREISYGPDLDIYMLDLRSYRGANTLNQQDQAGADTAILGGNQLEWLATRLATSQATWKIIACDMPIGLIVPDGKEQEAIANSNGPPRGRELEIAGLLSRLKRDQVRNTVWLTADVHYAAAHHYAPERAVFKDFLPFWEFVSGPLHAGNFGPNEPDNTFGIEVKFQTASKEIPVDQPPSAGHQYFGGLEFDADTRDLTVTQHNRAGKVVYRQTLHPED